VKNLVQETAPLVRESGSMLDNFPEWDSVVYRKYRMVSQLNTQNLQDTCFIPWGTTQ